jgi:4-coumarate--CoA ligase
MEGRLVDDDGQIVARGLPGELWVRGPSLMKYAPVLRPLVHIGFADRHCYALCREYVGNPKATKEALTSDGWYKTGDIMTLDEDGFLKIVDRKKELIKYKGFQGAY